MVFGELARQLPVLSTAVTRPVTSGRDQCRLGEVRGSGAENKVEGFRTTEKT